MNNINSISMRIYSDRNEAETVLNDAGIQIRTSEIEYKSFTDVVKDIASKWNEIDKDKKKAISNIMFDGKLESFVAGGFTTNWSNNDNINGKLENLNPNEIVLNSIDGELLLKTMEISKNIMMNLVPKINVPSHKITGVTDLFNIHNIQLTDNSLTLECNIKDELTNEDRSVKVQIPQMSLNGKIIGGTKCGERSVRINLEIDAIKTDSGDLMLISYK